MINVNTLETMDTVKAKLKKYAEENIDAIIIKANANGYDFACRRTYAIFGDCSTRLEKAVFEELAVEYAANGIKFKYLGDACYELEWKR